MPWLIPFGRDKPIFICPMEAQITYSSKSPIMGHTSGKGIVVDQALFQGLPVT